MARPPRRLMAEINVVPYIDVMLVLLVIFMITAPLLSQGIEVELPRATSDPVDTTSREPVIVTVDVRGGYYMNVGENPEGGIDADTLVQRVAAVLRRSPDTAVYVRGDKDVRYGRVVAAMSLLQTAGVPRIGLLTTPPDVAARP